MKVRILAAISVVCLTGCYSAASYRGDGRLYDAGWFSMYQRFWLDLGPLEGKDSVEYRLIGLPDADLTLGLQVESLNVKEAREEAAGFEIAVELKLTTLSGVVVIHEAKPLEDWVWTCGTSTPELTSDCEHSSFAYLRGDSREVKLKNGNTRDEQVGVKADGGWGTYFRPRRREEYRLEIRMRNGERFSDRHVLRVVASG